MMRKTIFIKPRLQFKYLFMSVLLTTITTVLVYVALSNVLYTSDRFSSLSVEDIAVFQKSLRFSFVCILVLLALVFGLESMFRFHRIVGPIHGIERTVKTIASGDLTQEFHSRKRDELKDLVVELTAMRGGLINLVESDRKVVRKLDARLAHVSDSVEQGTSPDELRKEIEEIRKELSDVSSRFKV